MNVSSIPGSGGLKYILKIKIKKCIWLEITASRRARGLKRGVKEDNSVSSPTGFFLLIYYSLFGKVRTSLPVLYSLRERTRGVALRSKKLLMIYVFRKAENYLVLKHSHLSDTTSSRPHHHTQILQNTSTSPSNDP